MRGRVGYERIEERGYLQCSLTAQTANYVIMQSNHMISVIWILFAVQKTND